MSTSYSDDPWKVAARQIARARCIVIGAGAGMNADSGLSLEQPDAEADDAVPGMACWARDVAELESPNAFVEAPELAWGWFAHCLQLSRHLPPHTGYGILKHWCDTCSQGAFVVTTNTDGHFVKAGFDPDTIYEMRGSLHWLQSCDDALMPPWLSDGVDLKVDGQTGRALGALPQGPDGKLARPNIQLLGDLVWNAARYEAQQARLTTWLQARERAAAAVLEIGVGTHTPIVRSRCAEIAAQWRVPVIRINPVADASEDGVVQLEENAVTALAKLHFLIASGQAED